MRVLLFTGKGGVGKTTAAAATAVHAARSGVKTLVLSTDAAHSLGDVLGVPLGPEPVEVVPGLCAQQVDARVRAGLSWRGVQGYVVGVLDALGVDRVEAEELTDLPGAEEVFALLEVRDQVEQGVWDLVVVDCAPTAETLRLLAVPEALAAVVEHLLPAERRLVRALANGARPLLNRGTVPVPRDHVVEAAERLHAELASVRAVLEAGTTTVRLVLTPEAAAVAEALRTWTALSLFGHVVDGVVVNRVLDGRAGADPWRTRWAASHAERLAEVVDSFGAVPVRTAAYADAEPVGVDALAALAEGLYGPACADAAHDLLAEPSAVRPVRVERDREDGDDVFWLVVDLPHARRDELDLERRGDELVVRLGARRRTIALPSALRRCSVAGATLRDGALRVRFEPDPDLWRPL